MGEPFSPLHIHQGAVLSGGTPGVFITADYPYYRDDARNWADRLGSLKRMGISTVTVYIPWRHHQVDPAAAPDFTGRTQPNRDVLGFLRLCADLGLSVIAKPGPFIHAEVNYGGLPDWVCPLNNPKIEALLNAGGEAETWAGSRAAADGAAVEQWPLPAPFSPEFLRLTVDWMRRVGEEVIRPLSAPDGPIVALQIANEGIYSNGQHAPWAYDYSPSALAVFRQFLADQYRAIANLNRLYGGEYPDWSAVPAPRRWDAGAAPQRYVDWGEFSAAYMDKIFRAWAEPLESSLPVFINQNPPLGAPYGLDAWLSRVEPERWGRVEYGFTNWVGDVSADESAFHRYVLTAKRTPGPNLEENWGFAALYAPAYADASTSFYQTLVILNSGATGFNVYTGVATDFPDRNLEIVPKLPYPDVAPVTARGEWTPKAEIVRWLAQFFNLYGAEFLACRTLKPAAWGYSLAQARLAAWPPVGDSGAPQHGLHLGEFQRQMRALRLDYGLANLETASITELLAYPFLYAAGGPYMPAAAQRNLAGYARRGGRLTLAGALPHLDENGRPCTLLREARETLRAVPAVDAAGQLADLPRTEVVKGEADLWLRSHPQRDLHFLTVLIPAEGQTSVHLSLLLNGRRHSLELTAAPSAGAILRLENGRVTTAILKGSNAYLGCAVAPGCTFDGQRLGLSEPGDFLLLDGQTASLPSDLAAEKDAR
jgi:beta-galactosidase